MSKIQRYIAIQALFHPNYQDYFVVVFDNSSFFVLLLLTDENRQTSDPNFFWYLSVDLSQAGGLCVLYLMYLLLLKFTVLMYYSRVVSPIYIPLKSVAVELYIFSVSQMCDKHCLNTVCLITWWRGGGNFCFSSLNIIQISVRHPHVLLLLNNDTALIWIGLLIVMWLGMQMPAWCMYWSVSQY